MKLSESKKNGLWGEIYAARYLRDHGYEIWDANYRTRLGELDIVAFKDDVAVVCEVKTRSPHGIGTPAEAVDRDKQRKILLTAARFMKEIDYTGTYRFDVIEVYLQQDGGHQINHIEQAFDAQASGLR